MSSGLGCEVVGEGGCDVDMLDVTEASSEKTVLAFDIETTGVNPDKHIVTCVCVYGTRGSREFRKTFLFGRDGAEEHEHLFEMFDEADLLYAYNGVRFDLPFLAKKFSVKAGRVGAWMLKLFDVFEMCKLSINRTFSLNALLAVNGCAGVFCGLSVVCSVSVTDHVLSTTQVSVCGCFSCWLV